ncbi:cytochrome P450 [Amycolatopsis sp. NPDC059027]|uniref:cytochrome P450 n=1 Tax=Amycolatopsis sp. NPDC059027 TaxID=3346709 RepID=UPI003673542C
MTVPATGDDQLTWFETMRRTEPVSHDEAEDVWHVFGHADVARVLTDPATFSSDIRELLPPPEYATSFNNKGNFLLMDPPEHRQLRGLVNQAFTPRLVASLAPRITKVTGDLLDQVAGRDTFDIVEAVAIPMPVIVIAELLGLPSADHRLFRSWGEIIVEYGFESLPSEENIAKMNPTLRDMETYLLERVRRSRAHPADDIISGLIAAETEGRRLDDEDIVGFATLLLLGGHVTTTSLLGNAIQCFDEFREATGELRAEPGLMPIAVEEVLRYRPPFTLSERISTRVSEVGGREIPAGARVTTWIRSANRDEGVFEAPSGFDIRRHPNPHLGFGRGIHFCVGAPLARLEADIALREILRRYREIAVNRDKPLEYFSAASSISAAKRLDVDVVAS